MLLKTIAARTTYKQPLEHKIIPTIISGITKCEMIDIFFNHVGHFIKNNLYLNYDIGKARKISQCLLENNLNITHETHVLFKYFKNTVDFSYNSFFNIFITSFQVKNVSRPAYCYFEKSGYFSNPADFFNGANIILPRLSPKISTVYSSHGIYTESRLRLRNLALRMGFCAAATRFSFPLGWIFLGGAIFHSRRFAALSKFSLKKENPPNLFERKKTHEILRNGASRKTIRYSIAAAFLGVLGFTIITAQPLYLIILCAIEALHYSTFALLKKGSLFSRFMHKLERTVSRS